MPREENLHESEEKVSDSDTSSTTSRSTGSEAFGSAPETIQVRPKPTLHDAVRRGNVDKVAALLANGADINARDSSGATALHVAAGSYREGAVVEVLLAAGADFNITDQSGETALHVAARAGKEWAAKLLIRKGANVHTINTTNGSTPLHLAAAEGQIRVVVDLLDAGADINAINSARETPLYLAAEHRQKEVFEYLLRKDLINVNIGCGYHATLPRNKTVLHLVASQHEADMVSSLIAAGANVMAQDAFGNTPLHGVATEFLGAETMRIIEALVKAGADVNARNTEQRTTTVPSSPTQISRIP